MEPRHLSTGKCLCQFFEDEYRNKLVPVIENEQTQPLSLHSNSTSNDRFNEVKRPTKQATDHVVIRYNSDQTDRHSLEKQATDDVILGPQKVALIPNAPTKRVHMSDSVVIDMNQKSFNNNINSRDKSYLTNASNPQQNDHLKDNEYSVDENDRVDTKYLSQSRYSTYKRHRRLDSSSTDHRLSSSGNSEVSLEFSSNDLSLTRSDDLIKKLRLLLELKKNELQNLDGSLFSSALQRAPTPFIIPNDSDKMPIGSLTNSNEAITETESSSSDKNSMTKGKRLLGHKTLLTIGTNNVDRRISQDANANDFW